MREVERVVVEFSFVLLGVWVRVVVAFMVMGVVFDFGWNAVPALSLYFFVASGFWGRVAVRLRAGVKEFSFQVDFS